MSEPTYYPQPVYLAAPPQPPRSGLAITGFVLSLVWALGFLSPIGLGLSIAGLLQIQRHPGMRGTAFAVWGIALGGLGTFGLALWIIGVSGT